MSEKKKIRFADWYTKNRALLVRVATLWFISAKFKVVLNTIILTLDALLLADPVNVETAPKGIATAYKGEDFSRPFSGRNHGVILADSNGLPLPPEAVEIVSRNYFA